MIEQLKIFIRVIKSVITDKKVVDCFGNVYENMRGNWYPAPYIGWRKLEESEECICGDCN